MIELSYSRIKTTAYVYIALPVMCFLLFYMNSLIGIGLSIVFSIIVIILIKKEGYSGQEIQISGKYVFALGAIAVIWTFLGGQGNLYYQSSDWHFRNAVYRDLLYRDWPVAYPEFHKAMVYYIGHWLPTAVLTRGIGLFFPSIYDTELAFQIGNIFLWIWSAAGVFIVEYLLVIYAKPSGRRIFLIPAILVFFSGLDIVGVLRDVIRSGTSFEELHIEWWSDELQFSSLTTCLFWVFNQTIIPWIVTLCVLQEKTVSNYIFLGLCAFASGPMPFVGIVIYMILYALYKGILMLSEGCGKEFGKEIFSVSNLLALVIMPVFLLYYYSNNAVVTGAENPQAVSVAVFSFPHFSVDFIKEVFFFLLIEAGVYLLVLYRKYRNDIFFYITTVSVLLAPFIRIGNGPDFVMRFSIPAIMVMAAMIIKYLAGYDIHTTKEKDKACCIVLCICLGIGAITPLTEFTRGYVAMLKSGRIINVADDVKTLNQDRILSYLDANIMTYDYENNVFFQYLAPVKEDRSYQK